MVSDIQTRARDQIDVPPGCWIDDGGSFEKLLSVTQRLQMVVPAALLIIFARRMAAFGSTRDAALVLTGVPMAITGVAALCRRVHHGKPLIAEDHLITDMAQNASSHA